MHMKLTPLSFDELHKLGIQVVYTHMVDNGYTVLAVRSEQGENPQILATKDGRRYAVVVRAARYPNMGVLIPETARKVLDFAAPNNVICLFASVGVANQNGDTDEEMAIPVRNGEYIINFKGLSPFPNV